MTDIIFINRYYGWYSGTGRLDLIKYRLDNDLNSWYSRYGKPLVLSEYGADSNYCPSNGFFLVFKAIEFFVLSLSWDPLRTMRVFSWSILNFEVSNTFLFQSILSLCFAKNSKVRFSSNTTKCLIA